jgi:5-methyltetrahydrofolate--homocysteine methyltransferase
MTLDLRSFVSSARLTDGAWGTQLQDRGLPPGVPPEVWNVDNAAAVEAVAASYVESGSDVILTNTFGANRFVLASHGLGDRAPELAEAGAALSRKAAGGDVKVFASVGPTGKIVMMGDTPEEELAEAFAEAASAVARGGADAIVLETFNELAELTIALAAARAACDLPVVASMTFASGPERSDTMMGDSPSDLVAAAGSGGAAGIGANCGAGPDNYVNVAGRFRGETDLPIWIKPNAGLPVVSGGETVYPMGPEEFASYVPKLIAGGANLIGGCCGTTPAHIRAAREAMPEA